MRELLRILSEPVTKSDNDGTYELKNMNDVLHETSVKETLDESLWWFLKVLYTDKRGLNLRNVVSHGIAPFEVFNAANAALVIQSIVALSVVRPDLVKLSEEEQMDTEAFTAGKT